MIELKIRGRPPRPPPGTIRIVKPKVQKIRKPKEATTRPPNLSAPERRAHNTALFKPRTRLPGEPTPRDLDMFARPLYDGAELRPFTSRAGAMDAFSKPSHGLQT